MNSANAPDVVVEIKEAPHSQLSLNYLKGFDKQELTQLAEEFQEPIENLEKIVAEYYKSYWWYRSKYIAYLGGNITYFNYVLNTSPNGFNSLIQVFAPNTTIPDKVDNGFGYALASANFVMNMTAYSPHKEAVKSTLQYAKQNPYLQIVKDTFSFAYHHPKQAFVESAKFVANQATLWTYNLTMSVSVVSDIYQNQLAAYGPVLQNISAAILIGMSTGWFTRVTNPDYYKGLDFIFKNEKQYPPLYQEIREGNFAIPLQIALQGVVSNIAITLLTSTTYFTNYARDNFVWWPPIYVVAPLSAWQLFCTMYPASYLYYMQDGEEIKKFIKAEVDPEINDSIKQQVEALNKTGLKGPTLEAKKIAHEKNLRADNYKAHREALELKVNPHYGDWIKQEPLTMVPLTYLGALGTFFGYKEISPLLLKYIVNEPISMSLLGSLIGLGLSAFFPIRAERQRIINRLVNEDHEQKLLQENKEQKNLMQVVIQNTCGKAVDKLSNTCNITSNTGQGLSTIGTGARTFGNNPLYMTPIATIATYRTLNNCLFFGPKIQSTWKSAFASCIKENEVKIDNSDHSRPNDPSQLARYP